MQNKRLNPLLGLLWITLAVLLAACGDNNTPTPALPAATTTAASPITNAAATVTGTATAAAATTAGGERIIKHARGETKVPANPQRVVVLDSGELDTVLTLGVKPVGAVTDAEGGEFQAYLKDKTAGITKVGTISQPNLEKIASLKPDLILSSKVRHDAIYTQLSQIAPTVFAETVGVAWKENFMLDAEALNKTAEAKAIMAAYDQRMAEFKAKLGGKLANTRVSIVRVLSDRYRLMMNASFIGTVLKDAGLPRVASQDKDKFTEEVNLERVADMDGDVIFITRYRNDEAHYKELINSPLWQNLNAVKANKVYEVPDDIWMLAIGMTGANLVIDDLYKYLGS
jgi:iron complex transport system substrate-binding protein